MADDKWSTWDLPVLDAIAQLEDGDDANFGLHDIERATDCTLNQAKQSLRRLENEYVTFTARPGDGDPLFAVRNIRLLPAGRRATRQWPQPEDALTLLVDALNAAADDQPDEDKKSKLRRAAAAVGEITGDLATNIMAAYLARISGIS